MKSLAILMALAGLAAADVDGSVGPLVEAARRGDLAEVARQATRLGPARLAELLAGPRDGAMAALLAIDSAAVPDVPELPELDDGWPVLAPLAAMLDDPDRTLAAAAARSLAGFAHKLRAQGGLMGEAPIDELAGARASCAAAAARGDRAPDVRVHALLCATDLGALLDEPGIAGSLLGDEEPEVRLAAADLAGPEDAAGLAGRVAVEDDPAVAAAVAAAACRLGPTLLDDAARTRVRALALAKTTEPARVIDMLACLKKSGAAEDKKVLKTLAKKGPKSVRRRAKP